MRAAQLMARWTHYCALMQPIISRNAYGKFLARKRAFVAIVAHQYVEAAIEATVFVAAAAPMLPLTRLMTGALLPHRFAVIEALGTMTVAL